MVDRRPAWLVPWRRALLLNIADAARPDSEMRRVVDVVHRFNGGTERMLAGELARTIRARIPYRFLGQRHEILSLLEVVERGGWGACADAAACAAAALLVARQERGLCVAPLRNAPTIALCYEIVGGNTSYAHTRVVIGSSPVEPFPEFRLEAHGCAVLYDVDEIAEH
jgi:hypothetical protein